MSNKHHENEDVAKEGPAGDFIRAIVRDDLAAGKNGGRVVTRFPPEPNGHLHIGHPKAIALGFQIAAENNGKCHLRFDDTNPAAEEVEFVDGIKRDIRWLGFDWGENCFFASDYFPQLYEYARELIRRGGAFVCDLSSQEIFERRGDLTEPGVESPYRNRSVEENLDLFERMKNGEFEAGSRLLRAKIDMASPVLPMRDPAIYRIVTTPHHRTGTEWNVYPLYDFAHCLSDAIEGVTHSLCTLEFVDRRPLYDWILDTLETPCHPQQIEFSRLNFTHTLVSKRALRRLVEDGTVSGWDDPRMATLAGARRRGYPPEALIELVRQVGVQKRDSVIQLAQLEAAVRTNLNETAPRAMGVIDPLKVVIENYPEGESEQLDAVNNPQDPSQGVRKVPFSREIFIEREDFMEDAPKKFFRLSPGREVRLRYAYFITCTDVVKNEAGEVVELRATYDPATRGGDSPDGRKVKGTLHWVSASHAVDAEVRLYNTLFTAEDPNDVPEGQDFTANLNPDALVVQRGKLEPSLGDAKPGDRYQFERLGYFCADPDGTPEAPVFNRTVTLRDSWAKVAKKS